MAHEDDPLEHERASWKPSPGLAVAVPDPVRNPELPPHRERMTDKDPAAMKRAVRTRLHALLPVGRRAASGRSPRTSCSRSRAARIVAIRNNNLFIGLGIALALLAIGIGAIHWSKAIMSDKEFVEPRHATRGRDTTRAAAIKAFADANEESGFGRRVDGPQLADRRARRLGRSRASCCSAASRRSDSPENPHAGDPVHLLSHTMWKEGTRLAHDPEGTPIRAADVTLGSAVHVIPEDLAELGHSEGYLEEKAKAIVLLMRLLPEDLDRDAGAIAGLVVRRHRRLLQGLHARRLPGRAVRAADAPPAVPLPPVAVRRHRPAPRSSSARPRVRCRSCPSPSTTRATSSRGATSPSPSARASGSAIEHLNRHRART